MAKISCSYYFLIIMLVFSVYSAVEKAKGNLCTKIINPETPYCDLVDCRLNCYMGYNGVGKCLKTKLGRDPKCVCTYNC
ncbi:PREDICTED: putative defensin-like protein 154 isoform X1 [Camelina sativa]|uniref:Defensin-like protein 154 isoform X1 n=1 Tax=Camelina sativa TaxID=90675 RepID=A0ABM1QLZ4_CAMSA|nr:PREDICTED: putative defensin-like protein 154 isoform X1 [Camelina sativa]